MEAGIIPPNFSGKQNDLSETHDCTDHASAMKCFEGIRNDLLHPNTWGERAGAAGAGFRLFSHAGEPIERAAENADLLQIDLPGPGTVAGGGYDWVTVEDIQQREDAAHHYSLFAIRVRPSPAPDAATADTAHFFAPEASSTFMVECKDKTVTVSYHGRNEMPNTRANHLVDKLRNAVTGSVAIAGVSELQWIALLKGLIAHNK